MGEINNVPTYTIWFYYGDEKYDGPRSLADMMDFPVDDDFREYFSDYKLNVICLNEIEDMSVFHTELRQLLKLMKHRNNGKTMKELLENDTDYSEVDEDTLYTMSVVLERPKLWEERERYLKEERKVNYNMCLAMDQIEEMARKEGMVLGREEGREEGEKMFASLINKLITLGKNEDALKATTDVQFRESLYIQYGLK